MRLNLLNRQWIIVVLALSTMLAACATEHDDAYKNAQAVAPLEVPPDLVKPPPDQATAVPVVPTQRPGAVVVSPKPAVSAETAVEASVVRSLRVSAEPGDLFSKLRSFLQQEGYAVLEGEKDGTIETEWRRVAVGTPSTNPLDAAFQAGIQNKIKLHVESGATGGSQIYISELVLQRVMANGQEQWQPRDPDPVLESEMLDRLQTYLGGNGQVLPVSATTELTHVNVTLVSTSPMNDVAKLDIGENFDRAWRRVGIALPRAGFVVDDRDRSAGLYQIHMGTALKEESEGNFFTRLFGSHAIDPNAAYRIHVQARGESTEVVVEHPGGAAVRTSIGERMLKRLLPYLN